MNKKTRKALEDRIARMSREERRLLFKRAKTLRRGGFGTEQEVPNHPQGRRGSQNWRHWLDGEDEPTFAPTRSRTKSLSEIAAEILHADPASTDGADHEVRTTRSGIVIAVFRDSCLVLQGSEEVSCEWETLAQKSGDTAVAVGDEVTFEPMPESRGRIMGVGPRRTVLARPDSFNGRRVKVIASNIDIVLIVTSAFNPPIRPRLIDRILIAAQYGGSEALLCVNKMDLVRSTADDAHLEEVLRPYREIGLKVILLSAATGQGLDELRAAVAGKTCVLSGHSGVGKSSILNALDPSLHLQTSEVSRVTDRGVHTTSGSRLMQLPGDIRIIDTPGIRVFGLWRISLKELASHFPDFAPHATHCRFSDCRHLDEPDCRVREAATRDRTLRIRYTTYRRIVATM